MQPIKTRAMRGENPQHNEMITEESAIRSVCFPCVGFFNDNRAKKCCSCFWENRKQSCEANYSETTSKHNKVAFAGIVL